MLALPWALLEIPQEKLAEHPAPGKQPGKTKR